MYKVTNKELYNLYKEVLTFNEGQTFASADELVIKKQNGSTFQMCTPTL